MLQLRSQEVDIMEREQTSWDLVADVVVVGSGGTGLPAAVAAIDRGASVIVVEANYDIGGHAIVSGGNTALGGGTSAQKKYGIEDSPDLVFADLVDVPDCAKGRPRAAAIAALLRITGIPWRG